MGYKEKLKAARLEAKKCTDYLKSIEDSKSKKLTNGGGISTRAVNN